MDFSRRTMVRNTIGLLSLFSAVCLSGCCCVPTGPACGGGLGAFFNNGDYATPYAAQRASAECGCGDPGCFDCKFQTPAALTRLSSCRGACGTVYVDEWINHPPVADNCGYDCGGCGHCGRCRPVWNTLKLLWGRPYVTACDTSFLSGPNCGCDSCMSGEATVDETYLGGTSGSSCNCGGSPYALHTGSGTMLHRDTQSGPTLAPPAVPSGSSPGDARPSTAPAIPLEVAPTSEPRSASRLNPAQQKYRQQIRQASHHP